MADIPANRITFEFNDEVVRQHLVAALVGNMMFAGN